MFLENKQAAMIIAARSMSALITITVLALKRWPPPLL